LEFLIKLILTIKIKKVMNDKNKVEAANQGGAMEADTISKNGRSLKSHKSKRNNRLKQLALRTASMVFIAVTMLSCASQKLPPSPSTKTISVNSEPPGAKVIVNGKTINETTPCTVTIPLTYESRPPTGQWTPTGQDEYMQKIAEMNQTKFIFIKDGYVQGEEVYKPNISLKGMRPVINYSVDGVFHSFKKQTYIEDPTIRAGEATNMVTRDNPGGTALERTIIRWNFDSDPRGCRIFWRVVSSVPDQVKNTNELYLTTTPYEETRSFNILGLTYENSRDVVIEIKLTRPGYFDQVKRYNVRQAIDQMEISGFFDMVKQ